MCGITGWLSFDRDLVNHRHVIRAMTDTLARRGPDDSGVWSSSHVALGHTRLAVIDPAGGRQPMVATTPLGRVVLVYSGEAYNYRELRAALRGQGHVFSTSSDTEVVLRGYLEWGDAVAARLEGMYAFAIWDERTSTLLLVRDRMGIKPLYYQLTDDGLVFGSEPKALHANPLVDRIVDQEGLREVIARTKTPGHAFWVGMRELLPGTTMTATRAGTRVRTYWSLAAREHHDDLATTIATVRHLLSGAVRRQLDADVSLCVLLSGGLDSSAITAMAAEVTDGLRTASVEFAEQQHTQDVHRPDQDAPFVADVVNHVGTRHRSVVLDAAALADPTLRATTAAAWDIPVCLGDLSTSLNLLFAEVKSSATVALSGESADELFGGYSWFHDDRPMTTFPWRASLAAHLDTGMYHPDLLALLDVETYIADRYAEAMAEVPHQADPASHLNLTRFTRMLLDRKDRMSMATGLEVRVPFCDTALVEYVYSVPWSMKSFDGREKSLLRAAVAPLLPTSVANRRKSMYPTTTQPSYVAEIQSQTGALLTQAHPASALFDTTALNTAATTPPLHLPARARTALEKFLDTVAWLDAKNPTFAL